MPGERGRIWFADNPWPGGHAIEVFEWSGRLDERGSLWFDLHLETVDYDAEADPACDEIDDWRAPGVWCNFHSATISSTKWSEDGSTGLFVGSSTSPLVWPAGDALALTADSVGQGEALTQEHLPAFHTYLLGHDAVGDHRVQFRPGDAPGVFDVEWTGRIALAYIGEQEMKHSFRAVIPAAVFDGFVIPGGLSEVQARRLFSAACKDAGRFELHDSGKGRAFCERWG